MHHRAVLVPFVLALAAPAAAQSPGFWEPRPPLQVKRQEVGAAVLNGFAYVGGGLDATGAAVASVERYDPNARQWTFVAPLPTTLHHFAMAAARNRLYVLGGYVSSFSGTVAVREYDPATNAWTTKAPLPRARGAMAGVTIDDKIYVVGGVVPGTGVVGELTVYDPATDSHRTLAPMPTPREHLAATAIGGELCVAGGRAPQLLGTLEIYDPRTNQWRSGPAMPTPRGGNGASWLDGKLLVIGGEGARIYPEVEEFDPVGGTWRRLADLATPVHGIYPVTIGGEVLVAGGGVVPGFGATEVVQAFRRLPDGMVRYGASTPSCRGAFALEPTAKPASGNAAFGFQVVRGATTSSAGVLVLGVAPSVGGLDVLGCRVHVDLLQAWLHVPVASDAQGAVARAVPLLGVPRDARFFAQVVLAGTAACPGPAPLSASDALGVLVR
jgi:hypothetical protein